MTTQNRSRKTKPVRFKKTKSIRCNGKVRYPNRDTAVIALASCKGSRNPRRAETRVYYCHVCRGWHLTSKTKAVKNAQELKAICPESVPIAMQTAKIDRWSPKNSNRFLTAGLHALNDSRIPRKEWANQWIWRKFRSITERMIQENVMPVDDLNVGQLINEFKEFTSLAGNAYQKLNAGSKTYWGTPEDTMKLTTCYAEEQSAWLNPAPAWITVAADVYESTRERIIGNDSREPDPDPHGVVEGSHAGSTRPSHAG